MVTNHPSNSIFKSSGNGTDLSSGMEMLVDPGIVITTANGTGVRGLGSNSITCNGTIGGRTGVEVTSPGSALIVGATGTVSGSDTGFSTIGSGTSYVVNNGTIFGGHTGMFINTGITIVNKGFILSGEANDPSAIYLSGSSVPKVVYNSGTIEAKLGGSYAILSGDFVDAPDTVTNVGMIKGYVALEGGDDIYDGLRGTISRGTIDGGFGNDKITGGVGVETMKGGVGNDTFFFKTKPDNHAVDHITDFEHGHDKIALDNAVFKGLATSTLKAQFHDITSGTKVEDADDRILYNHNNGALYYDKDGKGGSGPVLFAILDNHSVLNYADFLVV